MNYPTKFNVGDDAWTIMSAKIVKCQVNRVVVTKDIDRPQGSELAYVRWYAPYSAGAVSENQEAVGADELFKSPEEVAQYLAAEARRRHP